MILAIVLSLGGLVVLVWAADVFVNGAAKLAKALRISSVVIGVVVIGFGTSAPELLVSTLAASRGHLEIAVGNIVGSNVANMTLVLGLVALAFTPPIEAQILRREAPVSTGAVLLFALLLQGGLSRTKGIVLLLALFVALSWMLLLARRGDRHMAEEVEDFIHAQKPKAGRETLRTLIGLGGTLGGAHLLVEGSTRLAEQLGASEGFVGFTLVALGTTMPEIVTAFQAARQGETDLVIGNLLGSNMFNALAIGGVAALVGPGSVADPSITITGTVVMVVVSLLVLVLMKRGSSLTRWEGVLLLGSYGLALALVGA